MERHRKFTRSFVAAAVAFFVWVGAAGIGWADLRIVTESEDVRTETLFKRNRMAVESPDGSNFVLYCDVGELALIGSAEDRRYWRGTFAEFTGALTSMFDMEDGDIGMQDLSSLLGALFGNEDDGEEIHVRVTNVGRATVAGYSADHYVVETGTGNDWRVYEELWVSRELMALVTAEVGACVNMMFELQGELEGAVSLGMDELDAVLASPDYQALMTAGYPVRSTQMLRMFGMELEFSEEVVEVSRHAISEDAFTVPAGYVRVDSPVEVLLEL